MYLWFLIVDSKYNKQILQFGNINVHDIEHTCNNCIIIVHLTRRVFKKYVHYDILMILERYYERPDALKYFFMFWIFYIVLHITIFIYYFEKGLLSI